MTTNQATTQAGGSAADILSDITKETEAKLASMEERIQKPLDMTAKLALLENEIKQAAQIPDKAERDARLLVKNATFEVLRKDMKREEEDLSQAIISLEVLMEEIGEEFKNLDQPTPEELGWIATAEQELADAKNQLAEAKTKWNFLGRRDKAVAEAEALIKLKTDAIPLAQTRVKESKRSRLMKANIEQSMQIFMNKVEKTIGIMKNRVTVIQEQIKIVGIRKMEAFRIKKEAAEIMQKLDDELLVLEGQYKAEQENLANNLIAGTPEHDAKTKEISELGRVLEEKRGKRNQAFVLHQSKERFAEELEIHENAQMKLMANHAAWITKLRSDSEERQATFRSRLEMAKGMADQDVASNLNTLGGKIDENNVEFMARAGAASDRHRMEMVEEHPDRMRRLHKFRSAIAEAHAEIVMREARAIALAHQNYNIDSLEASHTSYINEGEAAEKAPAAGV